MSPLLPAKALTRCALIASVLPILASTAIGALEPDASSRFDDRDIEVAMEAIEERETASLTLDDAASLLDRATVVGAPVGSESIEDEAEPPPVTWESLAARGAALAESAPKQLPIFARQAADDLWAGRLTRRAQIGTGVVVFLVLLLVALLARMARGSGEIVVVLDYPPQLKGTFSVRLANQASPASRTCRVKTPEDAQRLGASTRTERHLVSRETSFRDVRCRRVYVSVEGFLETAEGTEIVRTHFSEREVTPSRGSATRVSFDVSPRACPVEVKVLWDRRAVDGALIARKGAPGSMRFARGPVQFSLDRGRHVIVAGSADRVSEITLDVDSFQPVQLEIDLADREHLLFAGCPPAVEPCLNGDVQAAARALERDGQTEVANRMLAKHHLEHDHTEAAAKHFEASGDLLAAADLHQSLHHFERAAALFEQVGEDERAAESYRSAGKLLRAGDAYARADAYDSAVDCFRKAGDTSRWIEALEKKGDVFDAACVALEQGERTRAIQCLAQVGVVDPNYPEAAVRLAEAYRAEGHSELAARKLEELIATRRDEELESEGFDRIARVLEEAGDFERALTMLERLRSRDAAYPNLATRIELLQKRRSNNSAVTETGASPGATAFSQEFRYEILEEVGRGGMGIVFRARDRRLGREVALKRLPDNLRNHPKAVELFLREARAAAALNHPNIVTLFDAGQDGDAYYLTMELLQGMPLQKVLTSRRSLSPAHVAKLGGQVATGLEYAHEQGIVHRDIKTANLFFTNKKLVKIMDFGLAKMVEEVRRAATVIGGTPYYMAPEQSAGEAVDRRADLYALGVTFYELLSGSVPFKEGDVAFHHRHTPPPDLRELVPDLPPAFADLIDAMMAKSPADRVSCAGEVRKGLAQIAKALAQETT